MYNIKIYDFSSSFALFQSFALLILIWRRFVVFSCCFFADFCARQIECHYLFDGFVVIAYYCALSNGLLRLHGKQIK